MANPASHQPYGFSMFAESAKLDGTNWPVWKTKVRTICMFNRLWDWLTDASSAIAPDPATTGFVPGSEVTWQDRDLRVYTFLLLNLSDAILQEVRTEEHAHGLWRRLTELFEDKSIGRIMRLEKEIYQLQYS